MMARRPALILSALSLLIGAVLMVVCVGAQWRAESFVSQQVQADTNAWRAATVVSGTSGVYVSWQRKEFPAPVNALAQARENHIALGFFHMTSAPQPNPFAGCGSFMNRIGFGYELLTPTRDTQWPGTYRGRWHRTHVPYWALIAGFLGAGVPAIRAWFARRRRVRRVAAGCCPSCGYDLRATPHGCPECGAGAKSPQQTAA
jgi:hypothetical protein